LISQILENQYLLFIILMVITAFPVGFFAGLFGIGGGLITVPFLFFIFSSLNIDPNYIMHLAVGTSFSIIIPTSFVSVYTHNKHGAVDLEIIKSYALFVIIGVIVGTSLASIMKTKGLILFFTVVVYFLSIYLLFLKEKAQDTKPNFNLFPKIVFGFISGFVSAPMGIGGAVMNVPILKYFGYPINKAIGSAAAIGFCIALFGAIGFLISGSYLNVDLPLSIGFINIPALLIFIPITTFMAKIGANVVHKIEKQKITKFFGLFLLVVGTIFLYRYLNI
tara:strand:+ start:2414 stop:3247 length:834 start_codon:yes stop_codon:yes gene_type:complete